MNKLLFDNKINLLFLFISLLCVIGVVGIENISFQSTKWLHSLETGTHQLGWYFFKNDIWRFPLGSNPNYGDNIGNVIVFSDSIPILALFFKLFKSFITENFQYFSFWIRSWKQNKNLYYISCEGRGYQTRDCLHPNDLANLISLQIKKIKKLKSNNRIFNVSGGSESAFSLKELSDWCCKNICIKKINYIKKERIFDVKWIVLDNSRAKREFKWNLKYSKKLIFKNILNEND